MQGPEKREKIRRGAGKGDKGEKMNYPMHKILFLLLVFIFAYGLGLLPLVFYLKFLLTLDLNNIIHLFSFPFLLVFGFVIFVLGEIISTGLIASMFKYKEGVFELNLDDPNMFRWLVFQTIYYPMGYFLYSLTIEPLKAVHLALCGAKIGKNVNMGSFIADPCLFEVGDNSLLGGFGEVLSHVGEKGKMVIKRVKIGKNCLVGEFALIMPGVVMEDGSILGANGLATKNMVLKKGKMYGGTPAKVIKK
jgi:hypothetical protein